MADFSHQQWKLLCTLPYNFTSSPRLDEAKLMVMNLSRCSWTALCGAWEGGRGPLWLTTDVRYDSLYWIDSYGSDSFKWIELDQSPHTKNKLIFLLSENVNVLAMEHHDIISRDRVTLFSAQSYPELKLTPSAGSGDLSGSFWRQIFHRKVLSSAFYDRAFMSRIVSSFYTFTMNAVHFTVLCRKHAINLFISL